VDTKVSRTRTRVVLGENHFGLVVVGRGISTCLGGMKTKKKKKEKENKKKKKKKKKKQKESGDTSSVTI